jgi:hypothetical protein
VFGQRSDINVDVSDHLLLSESGLEALSFWGLSVIAGKRRAG